LEWSKIQTANISLRENDASCLNKDIIFYCNYPIRILFLQCGIYITNLLNRIQNCSIGSSPTGTCSTRVSQNPDIPENSNPENNFS